MVFLWICIPLIIVFIMAAGYLQNRRRKEGITNDPLSPEFEVAMDREDPIEPGQTPAAGEKAYQGLLWLKGKYEEDIGQADTKFYELREEFKKLEKKYIDLRVHSISLEQQLHAAQEGLQQEGSPQEGLQKGSFHQIVSGSDENFKKDRAEMTDRGAGKTDRTEKAEREEGEDIESEIDAQRELLFLNDRLAAETHKVKELETRLASSSKLLMKMYKELAGTLEANNTFYKTKAHENRVKGLVKEFDTVTANTTPTATEERKITSWVESPAIEEDGQFEQLG